jgi:hypothetical protein
MKKNKIITLVVVVIIIILLALAGYVFYKKHHQNKLVVKTPVLLTWIDVNKASFPPYMVTMVPLFPKNSTVTIDRYYIDKSGDTHGEYAFDFPLGGSIKNQSDLSNMYLKILKYSKGNNIKSSTSSLIVLTQPYFSVNIVFTSPNKQTAQVDINYKFSPKVK